MLLVILWEKKEFWRKVDDLHVGSLFKYLCTKDVQRNQKKTQSWLDTHTSHPLDQSGRYFVVSLLLFRRLYLSIFSIFSLIVSSFEIYYCVHRFMWYDLRLYPQWQRKKEISLLMISSWYTSDYYQKEISSWISLFSLSLSPHHRPVFIVSGKCLWPL